ncbi:hypothetical protein I4U23_017379 [Adineta vaga]|nr:hypothetical protein I4U23_017379 [Adineta vaga]
MASLRRISYIRKRSYRIQICFLLICLIYFIQYIKSYKNDVHFFEDTHWSNVPFYIRQIPKQIIQTSKFSSDINFSENSFIRLNPTYDYLHYNDSSAEQFVFETMPNFVYETYKILPNSVMKADYFRYIALLVKGGIYSDMDTICLRPIDTWTKAMEINRFGLIIGIEADANFWDILQGDYVRQIQFVQWTIVAAPGHPILYEIVKRIADMSSIMKDEKLNNRLILEWTGPGIWTDVIKNYLEIKYKFSLKQLKNLQEEILIENDIFILPITGFSPGIKRMGSKSIHHSQAKVQHLFVGSWK